MKFTKVQPYGPGTSHWICGIYKITSYRRGEYHAYFIQEWAKNWGDHVCTPPDRYPPHTPVQQVRDKGCWRTLARAKASCVEHAKSYTPSNKIVKRAAEIKAAQIQQAIDFHCPDCGEWFDPYGKCIGCKLTKEAA